MPASDPVPARPRAPRLRRRDVPALLAALLWPQAWARECTTPGSSPVCDISLRDSALRALRSWDANPAWLTSANWENRAYAPWTDYLAGRIDEAEFGVVCAKPSDYCLRDVWNLRKGPPAPVDWASQTKFNWNGIHALALRFLRTGDDRYLGKWLAVVADFADWSLAQSRDEISPLGRGQPPALLDAAFAWGGIFTALAIVAKGLGPAGQRGEFQRRSSPYGPNADPVKPGDLELVPAATLLRIAAALADGHGRLLARFYADRNYVPNQRTLGLEVLAQLDAFFPTLPSVVALRPGVHAALADVLSRYRQLDGGQLEQSFNYAEAVVFAALRMARLPLQPTPAWRAQAEATATGWSRLAAVLATPQGGLPQLGNAVWGRFGREASPAGFAATSIALPYSGLYVQRSDWTPQAAYLFFFHRRAARGHSMAGSNSVQVSAFGRPLIVAGGTADYRARGGERPALAAYLSEDSSWKTSTVLVDGRSQRGGSTEGLPQGAAGRPDITRAPAQPVRSRWHASEHFDFLEGSHREGYQATLDDPQAAAVTDVAHTRQVVFVRALGLWVVVDILQATGSHQYTQVWKFTPPGFIKGQPGFAEDQVRLDAAARVIRTADASDGAVNVALHHFGGPRPVYQRHFGGRFGWYGPGVLQDAVPAVDVHAEWQGQGPQVLITLIAPARGLQGSVLKTTDTSRPGPGAATAACQIEAAQGARLAVAAAATPTDLEAGGQRLSQGQLLLVLQGAGGPARRLEVGAARAAEVGPEGVRPFTVPQGFRWVGRPDGLLEPSYAAVP